MSSLLEEHAREKAGMPETWATYRLECLPASGPTQVIKLTGAVAPRFASGKSKGYPNWKLKDASTVQEVYITPADHKQWLLDWEVKTGKCAGCEGSGQEIAGVHVDDGPRYRQCSRCGGSGKAKAQEVTA